MFFILGLIMSTALYGVIFSALTIFLYKSDLFLSLMAISLISYIALFLIKEILIKIIEFFSGRNNEGLAIGRFIADLTNPFRGIFALIGASSVIDDADGFLKIYTWGQVILHFIWSILIFGVMAIGILSFK